MKIRNMLGLALIGGVAYAHKKHGGEFTLESIRQSLTDLWNGIQKGAEKTKDKAKDTMRDFGHDVSKAADVASTKVDTAAQRVTGKLDDLGRNAGNGFNGPNRR